MGNHRSRGAADQKPGPNPESAGSAGVQQFSGRYFNNFLHSSPREDRGMALEGHYYLFKESKRWLTVFFCFLVKKLLGENVVYPLFGCVGICKRV